MKRYTVFAVLLISAVLILTVAVLTVRSSARSTEADRPRIYKSIEIASGDTLWEIAEKYAPDFDMNIRDYVSALKEVNGMSNDRITAGGHLIVICAAPAE